MLGEDILGLAGGIEESSLKRQVKMKLSNCQMAVDRCNKLTLDLSRQYRLK